MKIGKMLGAFEVTSLAIPLPERTRITKPEVAPAGKERRDQRSLLPGSFRSMPRLRPVLEGELFDP
jgi:hypothetical protein